MPTDQQPSTEIEEDQEVAARRTPFPPYSQSEYGTFHEMVGAQFSDGEPSPMFGSTDDRSFPCSCSHCIEISVVDRR